MINTILFDMGGTLEDIWSNQQTEQRAQRVFYQFLLDHDLHPSCSEEDCWRKIYAGMMSYRKVGEQTQLESKPEVIWGEYCLKSFDFSKEKVVALAEELADLWEVTFYHRELRSDVVELLNRLKNKGYRLGVISNTASLYSVYHVLEQYDIRHFFSDVTLSSITGYRKPHPEIFRIALYQNGVSPEHCMYVGDTISRDIIGATQAGFAKTVQIKSHLTKDKDAHLEIKIDPDYVVSSLLEIDAICPPLDMGLRL